MFRRFRHALCAAAAAITMLAGVPCTQAATIDFTDLAGRTVHLDKTPERIIVANYILNFMLVGGEESLGKVVAMTQDGWKELRLGEYTVLTEAFPQIKTLPSIGGYHDDILNSEKILALKPDVLLINRSQFADNNERINVFEKAGIRVVVIDYHRMRVEDHVQSTEILGKILERPNRAAAMIKRYKEVSETIGSKIAALPDAAKHRTVYVEAGNKGVGEYGNSYNTTVLWGGILNNLQAANIAADMKQPFASLSREFVLAKNPKTIVIAGSIWTGAHENDQMRMGLLVDEKEAQERLKGFAQRPGWQRIEAVKNGEIYGVDHGSLRSMLDYTYTMFLAKILYPEAFSNLDPQTELDTFWKTYLPSVKARGTFFTKLTK